MKTGLTRRRMIQLGSAAALPLALPTWAQRWPDRPIRLMSVFATGGLGDAYCRAYGEYLHKSLGQPVIVDPRPGGAGNIAALELKRSPPDGHTILLSSASQLASHRVVFKVPQYDPEKDFTIISALPQANLSLVVQKSLGVKDLDGLRALASRTEVNLGTPGAASFAHVTTVEMGKLMKVKLEAVHYRGEIPVMTDFLGGSLQGCLVTWNVAQQLIASGKGQTIAVSGKRRMSKQPDVPTFAEQGLTSDAFVIMSYLPILATAGLPEETANTLSTQFVEAGKSEAVKKLNDFYGNDESALDRATVQRLYTKEAPIWAKLVAGLNLPQQ
jgi:tripartite-type tricarboxylate transporter receptor subunit TctC